MWRGIGLVLSAFITAFILAATGLAGIGPVLAAEYNVSVVSCAINPDGNTVSVVTNSAALPPSDDGVFYLFASPVYAPDLYGNVIGQVKMSQASVITVALNKNKADSRLYSKFTVAVLQGGQVVQVSAPGFITNPEASATNTATRTAAGKKGLLVDPAKLESGEITDLGVKQAAYNIPLANICGATSDAAYPTINYTYEGKAYQFNGLVIAEYDYIFYTLSNQGIAVSAVLLNNMTSASMDLIHPYARDGSVCPYYAFNTMEQAGVEHLQAIASFLSQRYSGRGYGKVDNWIIGNEVTARAQWNYIANMDVNTYAAEYAKAVRLFYNAIKSENGNANIYVSIDQQWDRNRNDPNNYDGRDLLDSLAAYITSQGNIDWGIACHPYPVPLTNASFWTNTGYYRNLVQHSASSPFLTMENIEVLTDYLGRSHMLAPNGTVRSVIASEVGYTSAQGEQAQAAALTFGYQQAVNNQYIDALIVSRQTDSPSEIAQGLAMGLTNPDGSRKLAYDYYKNLDGANASSYMNNAAATMGIEDWGEVLFPR